MKESFCKSPLMAAYYQEVRKLEDKFEGIELHHVPQKDNVPPIFSQNLPPGGIRLRAGSSTTTSTSCPPAS